MERGVHGAVGLNAMSPVVLVCHPVLEHVIIHPRCTEGVHARVQQMGTRHVCRRSASVSVLLFFFA